jgi:sugar phosphate isomerase/epimerase
LLLAAASAASVFPAKETLKAGMQTSAWPLKPDDFPALLKVLEQLRELGFDGFETNYRNVQPVFGKQAKDAKAQIAATGLRFLGCHISLSNYDAKTNIAPFEQIQEVAEGASALGAERLILSGSPVAEEGPIDPQRLSWKSGALNRAGRFTQPLRMRTCYHNHDSEFANNGAEIEALMKEIDSDNVRFILDGGDAIRSKADLAGFFSKFHKRIDGVHIRDFNKDDKQVPLGTGEFRYEPLAIAIKKLKWTGWVIVEEEREAAVKPAREQLRKLFGV